MATATFHVDRPISAPAWLARTVNAVRVWRRRMRDRTELARWDDRSLSDAGTSRAAVDFELRKPFWRA